MAELADYNPFDPALAQSPFEYWRMLREHPVWHEPHTGFYMIARYEAVADAARNHEVFSNRFGQALRGQQRENPKVLEIASQGWPPVDTMLTADPPEQRRFRKLVNKAFTPRRVAAMEPAMLEIASELIDAFEPRGEAELVSEFAVPLPLTIIAGELGVPRRDLATFKKWSDGFLAQLGQMAGEEGEIEAAKLIVEFQHYFAERLEERRREAQDDIISDLVNARVEDERPLDTAECLSILQQLLVAGNETTASAIAEGARLLLENPEQLEKLRSRPDLIPNAVEEILRLASPTSNMWRVVKQDVEHHGFKIPAGAVVLLCYGAANRDPERFADPERFDVERENAGEHLAFGLGIHFCLGAMLSRRELKVAFEQLLARLENLRFAGEPAELRYKPSILLRGLADLPIAFG